MDTLTPHLQEELIKDARACLDEHDSEIDKLIDSWVSEPMTARVSTLVKYLKINRLKAKQLIDALDKRASESMKQTERVQSIVSEIQKDPYTILVEQLTFEYECFCKKHNIREHDHIPEELKNIVIFEFALNGKEKQVVPLWLARFLLRNHNDAACKGFFVSATRWVPPELL